MKGKNVKTITAIQEVELFMIDSPVLCSCLAHAAFCATAGIRVRANASLQSRETATEVFGVS
jgi:hypothetical protein